MLLKYFRSSHYLKQHSLWIIIALICWIPDFINPNPPDFNNVSILLQPLVNFFWEYPRISTLIAFLLSMISALLLNICLNVEDMANRSSALPSLIFVVFASTMPQMQQLNSVHFSLVFVLLSLYFLFKSYHLEEPYTFLFNSGFFISIAALFFYPAAIFVIMLFVSLLVFRAVKWREWAIPTVGILTPLLYFFTYLLWNESTVITITTFTQIVSIPNTQLPAVNYPQIIFAAGFFPISIFSLFRLIPKTNEMVISIRRMYWVVFWFIVFSFLLMRVNSGFAQALYFSSAPIAAITSLWILARKKYFWMDVYFTLWVIAVFISKFL